MDIRMRLFIGIVMILAIIFVFHEIKKKQIDIRHSLVWLLVAVLLLLLDLFPALLEGMAAFLGFELPVNMLFFLGFVLSIVIIFSLSAKVSKLNGELKKLMQEEALLEKRIEDLENAKGRFDRSDP